MADSSRRGERLGARARVDRPAEVIVEQVRRFGRRVEIAHAVLVHDVSVSGASLLLGSDLEANVGQVLTLSIEGFRGRVRVRWIRDETGVEDGADSLVFGVQFIDGGPAFMPIVNEWLDQEAVFHAPPQDWP
jgi:hypothetical protein